MEIKDAYTTRELVPLLGVEVHSSVARRATRESWQSRTRTGRGGGNEWLLASMPEATRLAIRQSVEQKALALVSSTAPVALAPAFLPSPVLSEAILDDRRRDKALAKADLVRKYLEWQRKHGATRFQKSAFVTAYMGGAWAELKADLGCKISWKSLERWKLEQERAGTVLALADKRGIAHRGRTLLTEDHKMIILGHILNPNAPKVGQCVREIQKRCTAKDIFEPSEATIRRFVHAYTTECYDEFTLWREGKKAWNDKCSISIMRDWNLVGVGDVVFADGHTLNFETLNPETGKPCRMTLLLFFDGFSSHPLGWEIMASENVACISAAFRRTCLILGKFPKVIYIDNGKAFRAKFFKGCADFEQAGIFGLYKSLGCETIHAWSYHGQTKTIERFFGTMHEMEVWMPSYTGNDIAHKPARMKRGETLHRKLYEKMGSRPLTLEETHAQVARWFCEYVQRPQYDTHLQGRSPSEAFQHGAGSGLSQTDIARMTLLMMQKEIRTITKDGFRLNGRLYWHECLASRRHPVLVRYDDVFSPHEVKVYTLDGNFLCEAHDRAHYHIACGVHPVARVLGTAEQQQELEAAIHLKKGQEKSSTAAFRGMLNAVILPETRARMEALEQATPTPTASPVKPKVKARIMPQAEIDAIDAAAEKGRAVLEAVPTYTPSALKRFKDEAERYAYLFSVHFEQGISLLTEDNVWMQTHETTANFQRNFKARYDALRDLYEHWGDTAQTA